MWQPGGPDNAAAVRPDVFEGQQRSFEQFVHLQTPRLYGYAVVLTGNHADAQDLTQEALLRAGLHWGRIRNEDPLAYIHKIMINLNVSRWRRLRRERLGAVFMVQPAADRRHETAEDRPTLISVLHQLPPRQRAVIVMSFLEDLSEAQIADRMQCAVGTVKSQKSRALTRLRQLLTEGEETS